jgi:hypothetical protein
MDIILGKRSNTSKGYGSNNKGQSYPSQNTNSKRNKAGREESEWEMTQAGNADYDVAVETRAIKESSQESILGPDRSGLVDAEAGFDGIRRTDVVTVSYGEKANNGTRIVIKKP